MGMDKAATRVMLRTVRALMNTLAVLGLLLAAIPCAPAVASSAPAQLGEHTGAAVAVIGSSAHRTHGPALRIADALVPARVELVPTLAVNGAALAAAPALHPFVHIGSRSARAPPAV